METREKASRKTEMAVEEARGTTAGCGEGTYTRAGRGEWKGLNGSKRKMEYDGGNAAKGQKGQERVREGRRERVRKRGARGRRGLRGKSARRPRCFRGRSGLFTTAAISSPSSSTSRRESEVPSNGLKTGILLPFVREHRFLRLFIFV